MSPALRFWSLLPPVMVVVPLALFAVGVHLPTPFIIFLLLFGLMLTGMPISISLGLTVLTYMFTMTAGADHGRRAQALHRHREVRDHGDPVLHPRRQFPHPRRRGAADDQLRDVDGRPLVRRAGARGRDGLRAVCGRLRLVAGHRGRDRLDHPAGHGQAGLPQVVRRGRHHHVRGARHPDSAVDRDGDVLGRDQHVGRPAVHGRRHPRNRPRDDARPHDVAPRAEEQLPAPA